MYHTDWLATHAARTPDRLALVYSDRDIELTYREFNERANRLAHFLIHTAGMRRGDRIAILAKNSHAYYEVYWACGKTGIILSALNWRLAVPELEYIIKDAGPRMVIYDEEFADAVNQLRGSIDADFFMVLEGDAPEDEWAYEDALAQGDPEGVLLPRLHYDDTWAILYTSGTTGRPKGAMVTYGNFFYNAVGMGRAMDLNGHDINLTMLPAFHSGGVGLYAFPIWHSGGLVVTMRNFDPEVMLQLIEKWQATVTILVPSMYLMLDQAGLVDKYDISSIRVWTSGGSPLPPSLVEHYHETYGITIRQGMGMTETGPTVFLITEEDALRKAGSVGKAVLHTEVCIMDQHHNVLGPNELGELCIRGNIVPGYWNNEEATREAIINGWLHSGDVAKYDEEGFFYLVDRWKDMFISGGENVYPAEVENVIYQHDAVAEVAVIGVPHPKWQEVGRAVVAVKEGHTLTEADVRGFLDGKLARYKIPKSVVFIDALPRNDIGKVVKTELRERFGEPVTE